MRLLDRPRLLALLAAGALAAGAFWALDDLKAWLRPLFQTSAQPGTACVLPTEHERLMVVFYWDDGKLRHRCSFVGSRGTYSRKGTGT